jgi:hypothetical protein
MRTRCCATVLASKAIDGESEEAGVLVCVFDPNRAQLCITIEVSSCSVYTTCCEDVRPAKASWSGVPA